MVGGRHQLNRREFEQAPGDGEGQGSLACCGPWGRKESGMTEQQQQCGKPAWQFLKKRKTELPYFSLWGIYPRELKAET